MVFVVSVAHVDDVVLMPEKELVLVTGFAWVGGLGEQSL